MEGTNIETSHKLRLGLDLLDVNFHRPCGDRADKNNTKGLALSAIFGLTFGCEFSLQNYRAHRFQNVLCSIHVFIFCRMDGENVKREWNWLQVFSLLEKSSHTVNHKAHFPLIFFRANNKNRM